MLIVREFRLFLLAAMLALASCGTPRSGPNTSAMLDNDPAVASYDVIELSRANIGMFLDQRLEWSQKGARGAAPALTLAPGDLIRVVIYERSDGGLFAPVSTGGSVFNAVRVDEAGYIDLPYAGRVRVGGTKLSRASELIRSALAQKAVEPEVYVELVANPSHSVLVTGDVKSPGLIPTVDGPITVTEAIARAGGSALPALGTGVVVRKTNQVTERSYMQVLADPPTYLSSGDQIIVKPDHQQFLALGAVSHPGLQDFVKPNMTLLEVIGQVGGLSDSTANPNGVFLIRVPANDAARAQVVHVDFRQPEQLILSNRLPILRNDIVYVTNAPVYEFQKLIAPLVQALIIGRSSAALSN